GAAGAGAHRHRHRLCHDGAVPRGAAGQSWPHRHRPCRRAGATLMNGIAAHLPVLPILIPLITGAVLVLFDDRQRTLKAIISFTGLLILVASAIALVVEASQSDAVSTISYAIGNWPVPFGIVLVADRLSAMMVLLATILGLSTLVYSLARWHTSGPSFHSLMHFLIMGLNGAFL